MFLDDDDDVPECCKCKCKQCGECDCKTNASMTDDDWGMILCLIMALFVLTTDG